MIKIFLILTSFFVILAVFLVFPQTRDSIFWFLNFLRSMYTHFIDVAPKPIKILVFLFFLIFVASSLVSFILGINFFCDDTIVYKADNIITGTGIFVASALNSEPEYGNLTESEFNSIKNDNSELYDEPDFLSPEALLLVQCRNDEPRLTLFGIPIFDYRTWLFLLILSSLMWLYFHKNK